MISAFTSSMVLEASKSFSLPGFNLATSKYPSLTLLKKTKPDDSILSLTSLTFLEKPSSTLISSKKVISGAGQLIKETRLIIKSKERFLPYP